MPLARTACPSDLRIAALLSGQLAGAELADLESHLSGCAECRMIVALRATSLAARGSAATEGAVSLAADGARRGGVPWDAERYEVRGEIARGGMGRILEAWDRRHHRPVAIKALLRAGPSLEARFAREVAITARLQHPSIVPLYDAGTSPEGEPYFVMKLVKGQSLATAFAGARDQSDRLALLPQLLAVTEALAYAHESRVVHRDLKPSNVLLGTFGETVVIDWGLAKDLSSDEEDDEADGALEARDDAAALTAAGQALGTPSYMAPEQARGEAIDARADVYAIGAMLYHLLSGAPPFDGATSRKVLAAVLAAPPPPLAERAPGLPADLVTIAEKAMARAADGRYGTAREMAADLSRFIRGQLVSAHAYSAATLAKRWLRKRRALVTMAAVFTVGLAVTAGLGVRRVVRERDRADAAKMLAEARGRSARAHGEAAERLVDYTVVELRTQLAALGKLELLSGIGAEVERYYSSLGEEEDALTAPALGRRAEGLDLLSDVASTKHDDAGALAREKEAAALLERAVREAPGDLALAERVARAHLGVADLEDAAGAHADALAGYRAADAEAKVLLARDPSKRPSRLLAVRAASSLSKALLNAGDGPTALETEAAVPTLLAQMVAESPADRELALQLVDAQIVLARQQGYVGRDAEMAQTEEAALQVLGRMDASDVRVQDREANALQMWSGAQLALGRYAIALEPARRSVALRERLIAHDPANTEWRKRLVHATSAVQLALRGMGRWDEARVASERSVQAAVALVAATHGDPLALGGEGRVLTELALTFMSAGHPERALSPLARAVSLLEPLARPDELEWRWLLADALWKQAEAELSLGDAAAALASAERADGIASVLSPRSDDEILLLAARARGVLGEARAASGQAGPARSALESARADFDSFWAEDSSRAEWLRGGIQTSRALARVLAAAGDKAAARSCLEQAASRLESLAAQALVSADLRPLLPALRAELARLAS